MGKLYDYLIVVYKFFAGLLASSSTKLILIALFTFLGLSAWISVVLFFKLQDGLSKKCSSVNELLKTKGDNLGNEQIIDDKICSICEGVASGWKNFKSNSNAKPSTFISKKDILEKDKNENIASTNFIFMRVYVAIFSVLLLMFSISYYGAEKTLTGSILAEAMIFPVIYYFSMKFVLFMFSFITRQFEKLDEEAFSEFVALLDSCFVVKQEVEPKTEILEEQTEETENNLEVQEEQEKEEIQEIAENSQVEEQPQEEPEVEQVPEEDPMDILDKYDIFKKKNIDVDKIVNEETMNIGTSLPYINVDSDYVIKDDQDNKTKVIVNEGDNASTILGGMMQDMSSIKKNNDSFLDVEKDVAELNEKKETPKEESVEEDSNIDDFEDTLNEILNILGISDDDEEDLNDDIEQEQQVEDAVEQVAEETEQNLEKNELNEENTEDVNPKDDIQENVEEVENTQETETAENLIDNLDDVSEKSDDEISQQVKDNIALAVSGFKSKRSKLASGGVVIERNEPISRRERNQDDYEKTVIKSLDADNDANDILNSFKSSAGGYDNSYNNAYNPYQTPAYGQNYGYPQQPYQNPYAGVQMGAYNPYQNQVFPQAPYAQPYDAGFNGYEQPINSNYVDDEEEVQKIEKHGKTKQKATLKNDKVELEDMTDTKTRGRPKKQEVSEAMTIKSDAEFDEVLSRAEKLMRKSEEGLSASQSKRIEKELSLLMDAMNRYKEDN